ncbi:glycerol-3-phosphate 1-O-acyltransferase PlsB [Spongorhabdus nitratireducens]
MKDKSENPSRPTSSRTKRLAFRLVRQAQNLLVRAEGINNSFEALEIDPAKPVCYVLHRQSLSDLVILDQECIKAGLPRPTHPIEGLDSDSGNACIFLHQPQIQHGQYSPRLVELLHQVEADPEQDIQLVPVSIFVGQGPDKEDSALKLLFARGYNVGGRLRRFTELLFNGRQTLVHFSKPISLRELAGDSQDHNRILRKTGRVLRVHFRQLRTSVIGPDLSHRRTMVDELLRTRHMRQAIEKEATAHQITIKEAEARALKYANEIVSDYSFPVVRFLRKLLTWFWNKLYDGVEVNNIERVQDISKTHEVVYIPCHRSHIDYLLLSYTLFQYRLSPPHIAAGINLNMPVVGRFLRSGGAFFMRRTFRGNPLYSAVFHEYLHTLYVRGFPVEYFIEGGRSRTGRTLNPKTGMLSITIRSFLRDHRRPICFVPVYIGYEKLLEVGTYLGELRGKKKKKESPLDIIRTLAELKSEFGRVSLNFGEPVCLNEFLDQQQPGWTTQKYNDEFKPEWLKPVTNQLGIRLSQEINNAAAINPVNMVATALLSAPRHALSEEELVLQLDTTLKLLKTVPYSEHISYTELSGSEMVEYVEKLKLVTRRSDSLGDVLQLEGNHPVLMTYYRNNILHMLALPSLICAMFLTNHRQPRRHLQEICMVLYPYLQAELFLRWEKRELVREINRWLDALVDAGLLSEIDGEYSRPDSSSTPYVMMSVMARPMLPTLERFYIVIQLLLLNGSGETDRESLEAQSQVMAQRLSMIHGINAPEFFDKNLFRSFIDQLIQQGILLENTGSKLEYGHEVTQVAEDARQLLTSEVRHSILQVTQKQHPHQPNPQPEAS